MKNEVTAAAVKQENIIILKSVYSKTGIKASIMPCPDPKTGRYPACVKRVDSHGDLLLSDKEKNEDHWIPENAIIVIEDGTTFDLDDKYQAAKWDAIKNCPLIAPSRWAKDSAGVSLIDGTPGTTSYKGRYGIAEFYISKPGEVSVRRVSKKRLQHNAATFILDDPKGKEGHIMMCRLLGKNMKNHPAADIEDYLLQIAEKNPQKIIDLYTGSDTTLRMLFMDAKDNHIIILKDRLYIYADNIVLGATDDACITWMKDAKNKRVLELIKRDTYPEMYASDDLDDSSKDKKK